MPDRAKLPNRRLNMSTKFEWQGLPLILTAGYARDGQIKELFLVCAGKARSSHLQMVSEDLAMLFSRVLQSGTEISELKRAFGTNSSLAGACAVALLELEGVIRQ